MQVILHETIFRINTFIFKICVYITKNNPLIQNREQGRLITNSISNLSHSAVYLLIIQIRGKSYATSLKYSNIDINCFEIMTKNGLVLHLATQVVHTPTSQFLFTESNTVLFGHKTAEAVPLSHLQYALQIGVGS